MDFMRRKRAEGTSFVVSPLAQPKSHLTSVLEDPEENKTTKIGNFVDSRENFTGMQTL